VPSPTGSRRIPGGAPEPARGTDRDAGGRGGKRRRVIIDAQASRRGPGTQGRDRRGGRGGPRQEDREPAVTIPPSEMPQVDVRSGATIKEMAESLSIPATLIIKTLMGMGELATITQSLSDEEMELVAAELERKIQIIHAEEEDEFAAIEEDTPESLIARAPVVTVMGHVDHGKTSLLDAIRETEVVAGEAGGITQHIGAYQVHHKGRELTFLDTPGHEAFTAMRARGAKITDVAVIVVAADDGVMETTLEAIDHARAADVPFMVAINKIDKPNANPDRVRQELSTHDVIPAAWGGTFEFVEVSAIERTGLDTLLETVLLVADADADPKANADTVASGSVIESRLDPGRGPVCTLLVQRGTMRVGDVLLVGQTFGRVRAMHNYRGDVLDEAGPSVPVEVLGMDGVPDAGERFRAVENERVARQLAGQRSHRIRAEELANRRPVSLEDLFARVQSGLNELNIIIKADVHGSVEALRDALEKIEQTEVHLRVIHTGVGAVTESDVNLAAASEAIIIAFNVRPRPEARMLAEREGVDVRNYRVIYRAIEDVRAALIGLLTPDIVEVGLGSLEVRTTFRASKIGTIAGCYVTEGIARRNSNMRLVRDGTIVFEGKIGSLRRFNDDVREVAQGFECGVVIDGFNDVKEGDVIEAYELKEVARTEQKEAPRPEKAAPPVEEAPAAEADGSAG
jgi:translation initiation factor IF-2